MGQETQAAKFILERKRWQMVKSLSKLSVVNTHHSLQTNFLVSCAMRDYYQHFWVHSFSCPIELCCRDFPRRNDLSKYNVFITDINAMKIRPKLKKNCNYLNKIEEKHRLKGYQKIVTQIFFKAQTTSLVCL